jgi:hypothetical protein
LPQIAHDGPAPFDEQLEHQGPEALIDGCPAPAASPPALSKAQRRAIAWLDGLGFPDIACHKLVRVATGQWQQVGNKPRENTFRVGFLLGDDGHGFSVLTLDLFTRSYERTPDGTPEPEQVSYEVLDLAEAAGDYLDLLERLAEGEDEDLAAVQWRRFGEQLSERSEVFVLARAAAAAGHEDLAQQMLDFAAKMPVRNTGEPPTEPLEQVLAGEIAHAMTWRAVLAFEQLEISRRRLLEKFEWLAARFPGNEHQERVEQTVAMLRRMIDEDAAHDATAVDQDQLEGQALIEELVFQLRDQNGHQWSQPGWCDVFADERGEKSPAHRLAALGYPAVPALIAALDDDRLSRSVGFHRDFYFSHTVLTVGDVALAVLQRIAGRGFYVPATTSSQMHKDDQVKAVKAEVEKWWAAFSEKGEQGVLAEATAAGDANSASQARLLVERYPAGALDKIVEGARKAEDAWVREDLVRVAATIEGDEPVPFLEDELANGPFIGARVAAAVGLHVRGKGSAVPAMIRAWQRFGKPDPEDSWTHEKLIGFLAGCGDVRAIEALETGLDQRPVDVRLNVVSALGDVGSGFSVFASGVGSGIDPGQEHQLTPEVEQAMEQLLAGRLTDLEEREGMSGTWDGEAFTDPRICDVAAHVLEQRFADRYSFKMGASLAERERQRVTALNVWRKGQGQEPLPVPEPRTGPGLDDPSKALDVRQARVEPAGKARALEKKLARLEGQPLAAAAVIDLLVWVSGHLPPGTTGIKLVIDRPGDGTGAVIVVRLLTNKAQQEGSPGWHTNTLVSAGGEALLSSSGTSSRDYRLERESWKDVERSLERALGYPPAAEIRFRQTLVLEE